ncbi:MAG: LysM peptidoglycan-binding domain-containing protein [Patescibacteria group bacterium]
MSKISLGDKREETISMLLGLTVVAIVVFLIFNFIQRRKGNISLPGISQKNEAEKVKEDSGKYDVKKGDSLWKIASSVYGDGYKWQLIAKENNLSDPDQIEVGQKLIVPTLTPAQKEVAEIPSGHKVLRGESLWKIATIYYADGFQWTKIWELNRGVLRDPDKLEIGMMIKLK